MRTAILALLCAALMQFMSSATAADTPGFDYATAAREATPEILADIRRLQEVKLIRGNFRQQKNLKILKQPFTSRGWFIFSKQNGLYWEITEPMPGAYLIGKNGLRPVGVSTGSGTGATIDSPFADAIGRMFSSILGANLEELQDHFEIYYQKPAARWQIGLKPRNRHIAAFVSSIEITGEKYIDAIRIVETGGDTADIAFTSVTEELPADLEAQYFNDRQ
jgi:hypothetical protein